MGAGSSHATRTSSHNDKPVAGPDPEGVTDPENDIRDVIFTLAVPRRGRVNHSRRMKFVEGSSPRRFLITLSRKGLRMFVRSCFAHGYLTRGEEPAKAILAMILNSAGEWPSKIRLTSRKNKARTKRMRYGTTAKVGFFAGGEGGLGS